MTHTNRKTNDVDLDRYWTPSWPTRLLLDQWGAVQPGDTVAEPCCGRGDICTEIVSYGCRVAAGDIEPMLGTDDPARYYDAVRYDVLSHREPPEHYQHADLTVTNPPYSADTGTAGDVLEAVVDWQKPTAALLPLSWQEYCKDRRWAWGADDWRRPQQVWVLPRVEYDYPGDQGGGSPGPSMWVIWHPEHDGSKPTIDHYGPEAKAKYQGQTSLLEVAE